MYMDVAKQNIKTLALKEGSFYAYQYNGHYANFYLISPTERILVLINHNM